MDPEVVVRAQHGDEAAFESITVAGYPRLYRIAYGILREHGAADDAAQQALVDIWRRLPRLGDPERFDGWSYRLLVRICYAEAKRRPKWLPDKAIARLDEPRAWPIATPSAASMAAALIPDTGDGNLFFFACPGSAKHEFARTFEEHLENTARCE